MTRYLIIGNGVAGLAGALSIRNFDSAGDITIVGEEPHLPYFRAGLSEWMHGAISDEELAIRPERLFAQQKLHAITGRVTAIDVDAHTATLHDGDVLAWDKLLLATGAEPIVPPWPGRELRGVYTYRSWDDCRAIMAAVGEQPDKPVVIIGAGILGLEFAWDCKGLGVRPTMLVRGSSLGSPIFDEQAGAKILQRLRDDAVDVHFEEEVLHFEGDKGALIAVVTNQGRRIECSAAIVATGVAPTTSLLDGTGILTDRWIKVDGHLRTSHSDIYAAGDVATVFDPMLQTHAPTRTWEPSYLGGQAAGENMAGGSKQYVPCAAMNASLVYDLKYVLLGGFVSHGSDVETIIDPSPQGPYGYRKLLLKDDVLVGATFLHDRRHYMVYRELMQAREKLTKYKDRLLSADFDPNLAMSNRSLDYYFF